MLNIFSFFTTLSDRLYKENDLSDVTYAMCESDECFKQFFLDFFFPNAKLDASSVTIEREHVTQGNGRPDFWIIVPNDKPYIVEVKIWDGNHHFEQYYNELNDWSHLGYIANYDLNSVDVKCNNENKKAGDIGCRLAIWKDFVNALEQYQFFNDSSIEAYAKFVKRVCPFDDFNLEKVEVSLEDFKAISRFIKKIDKTIEDVKIQLGDLKIQIYTGSSRYFISQYRMGRFFEFDFEKGRRVWGWIGTYYYQEGGAICVEFEDRHGWGKFVCDCYRSLVKDGCLRFYYKNQNEDITSFFYNILKNIIAKNKYEVTDCDGSIIAFQKNLLIMKILPCILEQKFFSRPHSYKINDIEYDLVQTYGNDAEVPNSHSGRYFELKPRNENSYRVFPGWIGVNYPDEQPTLEIDLEKTFVNDLLNKCNALEYQKSWEDDGIWKCKKIIIHQILKPNDIVIIIEKEIESLLGISLIENHCDNT